MNDNPYAAPQLDGDSRSAPDESIPYFQSDSRRVTYAEYWKLCGNWLEFILSATFKTLHIRLRPQFAFARFDHMRLVDVHQVGDPARATLRPLAEQFVQEGLRYALSYQVPTVGLVELLVSVFLSEDRQFVGYLVYVRFWNRLRTFERIRYSLTSELSDGRMLVTTSSEQELFDPPGYEFERRPRDTLAQLVARHRERIANSATPPVEFASDEDLLEMLRRNERRTMEFHYGRGVYREASAAELNRLARLAHIAPHAKIYRRKPLQGLELACWIGIPISVWTLQSLTIETRFLIVLGLLMCVVLIWIYRLALKWTKK